MPFAQVKVIEGVFTDAEKRNEFRKDLAAIQDDLRNYARLLAEIAQVEDLTSVARG